MPRLEFSRKLTFLTFQLASSYSFNLLFGHTVNIKIKNKLKVAVTIDLKQLKTIR